MASGIVAKLVPERICATVVASDSGEEIPYRQSVGKWRGAPMPLQIGTWTINSNGVLGQVVITSVDSAGNLNGTLIWGAGVAPVPIQGFWNELSQEISFGLAVNYVVPPSTTLAPVFWALFTGYLFIDQMRMAGISGAVVYTLAGSFQASGINFGPASNIGSARRHVFAWYAQIGVD